MTTLVGPNAVISGGVVLGSHTVVGAGSIVLKSFGGGSLVAGAQLRNKTDGSR